MPDIFLNARYSPVRLMHAAADEVMTEVQELADNGKNYANRISASCVGMDEQVTDEQVRNFLNACKNVQLKTNAVHEENPDVKDLACAFLGEAKQIL